MDINLIVARTLNTGICMAIIHEDAIFEAISEDGAPPVNVDVIGEIWLEVVEKTVIGCVRLTRKTSHSHEAHIHILPEHRDKSMEAGEKIWEWIVKHLKGTIYVTVPRFCENVINYLTNFDFKQSGVIPRAWLKNNERHDLIIMSREV